MGKYISGLYEFNGNKHWLLLQIIEEHSAHEVWTQSMSTLLYYIYNKPPQHHDIHRMEVTPFYYNLYLWQIFILVIQDDSHKIINYYFKAQILTPIALAIIYRKEWVSVWVSVMDTYLIKLKLSIRMQYPVSLLFSTEVLVLVPQ